MVGLGEADLNKVGGGGGGTLLDSPRKVALLMEGLD